MQSPQMRGNSITIAAGVIRMVHCHARMLRIWECSANYIAVSFDGQPYSDLVAGAGYDFRDGEYFSKVEFHNTGGAAVTLTYTLAQGRVYDDRVVIAGTVVTNPAGDTINTPAAITVTATAVSIAANTGRREIILQNNGTENIWIGDANVDGNNSRGIKIAPDMIVAVPTEAAVYHRCETGKTSTLSILENDRS